MSNALGFKKRGTSWTAWRCAGFATLALSGCVIANVAGCGGGGTSPINPTDPTQQGQTVTIGLVDANAAGINGTITLNGVTKTTSNARATFTGLAPGQYPLTFTVAGQTTTTTIIVNSETNQTFVASPGFTNVSSNGIRVTGRVLLNSPATSAVVACTSTSTPVTAALVIRVRALNIPGQPIIASILRPAQNAGGNGSYAILSFPRPGTYRVEARSINSNSAAQFTGTSASFTVTSNQSVANLDICVNSGLVGPGGTPPPPPGTPTPAPGTPGAGTPGSTNTPQATVTNTPIGGSGVPNTPAPGSTNTPVPADTATPVPTATAVATATPVVDPSATATTIGQGPTPTPIGQGGTTPTATTASGVPGIPGALRRRR